MLLALATGCPSSPTEPAASHPRVKLEGERHRVELFADDQALGGDQPLVTIVVFSDYACPPCGRTWHVMENLVEDYGDDLRVVYRAYTVQSVPRSEQAAEAVLAAGAQGKFWEMHHRLFEAGGLDRPTLRAQAEALGLDVPRFLDELDTGAHTGQRVRHRRQAKALGVVGLPSAFVNGYHVAGFTDEQTWHGIIDDQIASARELLQSGTPRAKLYETMMAGATEQRVGPAAGEQQLRKQLAESTKASQVDTANLRAPDPSQRYAVRVGDAPATGAEDAPVEVVVFFDFECPYCRRAWQQEVGVLVRSQPDGVRLAVRQLPLEIHPSARGAALAALAAHRQGRFWAMFERLVGHEGTLGRSDFVGYAEQLGLDRERFLADLDDPKLAAQLEADVDLANRVGVRGTPGIFVNGRYLDGYSPGVITTVVEEEQAAGQALVNAGIPRHQVVDNLMKDAIPESEFPNK